MKKFAFLFLIAAMALGLASCKEEEKSGDDVTGLKSGFYILNQGNMSTKLPGSIIAYNADSGESTDASGNAFMDANNIELGEDAMQMIQCGSRMFISVYTSNIIWAVDPYTLEIIGKIQPTGVAVSPRYMTVANGKLYVSMYTGYVCEIDPLSLEITRTVKVGPNPEQLAVLGQTLVVTNSDGMNLAENMINCSLSFIDLKTFTQTELKDYNVICNPTKCVSNGTDLFIICMGNYADIPAMVKKVTGNTIDDIQDVCLGTEMNISGNNLFVINSPFGGELSDISYKAYDTKSLSEKGDFIKMEAGKDSWIEYPVNSFINPENGEIIVLSYRLASNGYAQFTEPCYANIYDKAGNFKKRIECGVCATDVVFINKK